MRWFFRIVVMLAFACLAVLATLPHLESIEQGWQDLRDTWVLVRSGEHDLNKTTSTQSEQSTDTIRSRKISPPSAQLAEETPSTAEDPFIAETRARASTDPEGAMNWLQNEVSSTDRLRGMLEVVALWAAQDSESALLWLESNAQGLARHEMIHSGMELWSQQDPSAAATWIEGMANDGSKSTAAQTLAANWARTNQQAAANWLNQLPSGTIRNEAANAYAAAVMETDPLAAADWAIHESVQQGNPDLLVASITAFTRTDPIAAERYIRSLTQPNIAEEALTTHIQTLAGESPMEAANWIASLSPTDPLYNHNLHTTLMREWSQSDSVMASTWLADTRDGPARDAAIIGFAETMIDYEPEAVAAWTNTINDPKTRVNWLTHAVQSWARMDPVETLRWIQAAELDPALRAKLAREVAAE